MKRLCADDSAGSRVKVGHRQAIKKAKAPTIWSGLFALVEEHWDPLSADHNAREPIGLLRISPYARTPVRP